MQKSFRYESIAAITICTLVGATHSESQSICIHEPLEVSAIKGQVLDEKARPIETAVVRVSQYRSTTSMATNIVNPDGRFDFGSVVPGRYSLTAEYPHLTRLDVAVKVTERRTNRADDIHITLVGNLLTHCDGNSVRVARPAAKRGLGVAAAIPRGVMETFRIMKRALF
jgi:hypothetical protein